jgi:hypothetical protein
MLMEAILEKITSAVTIDAIFYGVRLMELAYAKLFKI